MTNTISASANPVLANNMLQNVLQEEEVPEINPEISLPLDNTVELPGGYINAAGEVIRTAEVRELTGKDEEAIAKTNNIGKALMIILQRGVVKIGDEPATEKIMDNLLTGDRDALLLGILKSTFGATPNISSYCAGCNDIKEIQVDLNADIKVKVLADPVNDRVFTVTGKTGEIVVQLPTGITQKELINNAEKSVAELNTLMLGNTVVKIGDTPVYSKLQVQNLSIVDRKKIVEEISNRNPGPQFEAITVTCPDCEGEVSVPINLGTLFQF
jgi:hypothetical protein